MHRTGGTNEITNRTLSPDEVIGQILNTNNVFIPIAVGPFGDIGSIFRRFIKNQRTLPLPSFPTDRPNALRAAEHAINVRTPYDVFGKAENMETPFLIAVTYRIAPASAREGNYSSMQNETLQAVRARPAGTHQQRHPQGAYPRLSRHNTCT